MRGTIGTLKTIPACFTRSDSALAALGWFVNPWLFIATTTWVVAILHRRDFHSATVRLLSKGSG